MNLPDSSNEYFNLALQFVNTTSQHVFLTGKAGTGKTTFLKFLTSNTPKKHVVVSPTGVAAINAGGVTIHSFFQLPPGSFLPTREYIKTNTDKPFHNQFTLTQHLKISKDKRSLMEEMELLIIDEVSMARADIIDAIDYVLRFVRRKSQPFGGVQVLFIGDMFQLPPVVNDEEWQILNRYYLSPFFFDAVVLKENAPVYIELKKVYRQSDTHFINLLNNIRNNKVSNNDLELLKQFYKPGFKPETSGEYITLTSHNFRADTINKEELSKIPGNTHVFEAEISGEFNEYSLPTDKRLFLKEGAQIMFVRNDSSEQKLYYNGKIATVKKIKGSDIIVTFPGGNTEYKLEKETWENVKYSYDNENDNFEKNVLVVLSNTL